MIDDYVLGLMDSIDIKGDFKYIINWMGGVVLVPYLYDAIKNDELRLEYLPKYCIGSQEIVGAEALLRWDGYDMNIVDVIDFAERTGLITQLTKWIVGKAVNQLGEWKNEGLDTRISINISMKDLSNDFFLEHLNYKIREVGVEADMVELEISEKRIFEDTSLAINQLNKIRQSGFGISIDDYGSGYNAMTNIPEFFYDRIKIDKFLIDRIEDESGFEIINKIIRTARKLGMTTVAEGVETEAQYMILEHMGCDVVQGYYISVPLRPDEYKQFI